MLLQMLFFKGLDPSTLEVQSFALPNYESQWIFFFYLSHLSKVSRVSEACNGKSPNNTSLSRRVYIYKKKK